MLGDPVAWLNAGGFGVFHEPPVLRPAKRLTAFGLHLQSCLQHYHMTSGLFLILVRHARAPLENIVSQSSAAAHFSGVPHGSTAHSGHKIDCNVENSIGVLGRH